MKKRKGLLGKGRIAIPRTGTRAARDFVASWETINRFVEFVVGLVAHTDGSAAKAHEVLVETARSAEERDQLISSFKTRVSATEALRKNRQFFMEVVLVRHVENYLNYVSSLLHEIFLERPETLRSSEKIEVSVALQSDSIEGLIRELAERKVEALSYSSFSDLAAFFDERFKLELATPSQLTTFLEAIEVRNISVHNRCIINKRYNARLKRGAEKLGTLRVLGIADLDRVVPLVAEMALALDRQAHLKFKLRRVRFVGPRATD